ncbi:MAG TPA: O-antigen ligase family protein [Acidimicrobiales bacterium]|nr:O-antigen ligase family protein [Acidimicrobiales bacterium]
MFFLPLLHFKATKGLNLSDLIFLIGFIFLILSRRPPSAAPRTPAWYVGAFMWLLAAFIASTQSSVIAQSIVVVFNGIYVFFILQYLLRQQLGTTLHLQRAMGFFVFGSALSAFVALCQVELHIFLFQASAGGGSSAGIGGNSRAIGLSNQPNLAGISFALGILFAVGLILELGNRRHWYLGVCVFVMALALLLVASLGGMASVLLGLLVLFIARGTPLKTVGTVVLALVVAYLLVFAVIDRGSHLDPITRIEKTTNANAGSGGGTLELRIHTWQKAWSGIEQAPILGHGLDQTTLAVYWDNDIFVYYAPHNLILLYWFGGGIFLLIAMFIMMGSSVSRVLAGRRHGRWHDPMKDIILAAIVADFLFCMQSPELVDRWLWLPFLLALTLRDRPVPSAPALEGIEHTVPLSPSTPELAPAVAGNGGRRRVRGTVGRHAAPEQVDGPPDQNGGAAPTHSPS